MSTERPQAHRELTAEQVRRRCDPRTLSLAPSANLPGEGMLGQDRALDALALGVSVREPGFNIYVAGPAGVGKMTAVRQILDRAAADRPTATTGAMCTISPTRVVPGCFVSPLVRRVGSVMASTT